MEIAVGGWFFDQVGDFGGLGAFVLEKLAIVAWDCLGEGGVDGRAAWWVGSMEDFVGIGG